MTDAIKQATSHWEVGNVKITRVIELEHDSFPPGFLFDGLTKDRVKSIGWLHPNYADPDGTIRISIHAYVIESQRRRIILDPCVGNDKPRSMENWNMMKVPFLERLAEAGFTPDQIDFVLCTHLHLDHVGWNTRWDGKKWVPTFPNARYIFGRLEWDHWSNENRAKGTMELPQPLYEDLDVAIRDSVLPVVEAGLHDLVETDHRLTEEVSLFPTPGHTPGHVAVSIRSKGKQAVITGDLMHNPVQIADPNICSNLDVDKALALETRRAFIGRHVDKDILVLGTHFPTPSGGHIVRDNKAFRFVAAGKKSDD